MRAIVFRANEQFPEYIGLHISVQEFKDHVRQGSPEYRPKCFFNFAEVTLQPGYEF